MSFCVSSVLITTPLAKLCCAQKSIISRLAGGMVPTENRAMFLERKHVTRVRTECRRASNLAVRSWGNCGYPTISIKTNPVIVTLGGMSESYVAENMQHSGMDREKKRGPHNMEVSPIMCMKIGHRKKVACGSPTMFVKRQDVTRSILVYYR